MEVCTMIILNYNTVDKYQEMILHYKKTKDTIVITTTDVHNNVRVYGNKPKWTQYVIEGIYDKLLGLGLRPVIIKRELWLYNILITKQVNQSRELVIKSLDSYGISNNELIDMITDITKDFMKRRGIEC